METEYHLSRPVRKAITELLECAPPAKLRRTLRCLLLEYLSEHMTDLPPELDHVAEEFNLLFRFLETADELWSADGEPPKPQR